MTEQAPKKAGDNRKSGQPSRFPVWNSTLTALLVLGLIALWMASGEVVIGGSDTDKVPPIAATSDADGDTSAQKRQKKLFTVKAQLFTSQPRKEVLHIRARTEADKSVQVRSETSGRVEAITGKKGSLVKQGTVLCKLNEGARQASLLQAQALVAQTGSDYFAAEKLARRGVSAKLNVKSKKAAYDSALASLERAQIELDHTAVKAPFTGLIEDRPARIGDYLPIGSPCASLVKLDPLLIVGEVSERNINQLRVGQKGTAKLVTGEEVSGKIRFISPSAKVETRTFRIELEVDNKDLAMRNGVTADIYIPLKAGAGHRISPALLTLSDEGDIGVRTVDEQGLVHFRPVRILEQGKQGVWVTGLPEKVVIITTGQDYVKAGQKVEFVLGAANAPAKTTSTGAVKNERS